MEMVLLAPSANIAIATGCDSSELMSKETSVHFATLCQYLWIDMYVRFTSSEGPGL